MFSKDQILASIATEHHLIKHLHSKLTTDHLEYRPSDHQRTLNELLQYISRMTTTMATMLKNKAYTPDAAKELRIASEEKDMITDFDAEMDAQLAFVTDYVNGVSDADLAEEVDLFGMNAPMPIGMYFLNILFKNYAAYRMQLFHYMKDGLGMTDLKTSNLWMWMDS